MKAVLRPACATRLAAILAIALPFPAAAAMVTTKVHSTTDNAYAPNISATDLVNARSPRFASVTRTQTPNFGAGAENDGAYNTSGTGAAFYPSNYSGQVKLPVTLTFSLNLTGAAQGYDIVSINSFAGWKGGGTQTYANQKFTVEYQRVGSTAWTLLSSVDYSPFTSTTSNLPANSWIQVADGAGVLASRVQAIRLTYVPPSIDEALGAVNGIVIQEIDVIGYPTGVEPAVSVALARPMERQIVQRAANCTGSIRISGSYTGLPDSIEARAVVMGRANHTGVTTGWTPIVTAPVGGTFAGTLSGVAAGGWYRIEVRAQKRGVVGAPAVVQRVGVGDIYIAAGQSNSANYGTPKFTAKDDRVSVWSFETGVWTHAADPIPGADGTGGSVWTRLGDLLRAQSGVPIGFASVGVGGTAVARWVPGANDLYPRLQTAVQAFPAHGFRAILWHQGESDSLQSTTPADYASRLQSVIAQSRADAGWPVPWYVAEVGFHPKSRLVQEEPVVAGQRRVIFADPLVFLGPTTDDFHLEGKTSDGVHFNAAGLADHAAQWAAVLSGTAALAPKNFNFESNPLPADGSIHSVDPGNLSSPSIIGWRALSASGEVVADSAAGYYNPNAAYYTNAADAGPQGGLLPGMNGRHVGFLWQGTAGNHFLQTLRAPVQAAHSYTLTVALGVRSAPNTFGGAKIELLVDGQTLGTPLQISRADLDARNGGNAAGTFTDVTLTATTSRVVPAGATLGIRITKVTGGGTTYLDIDDVRLTSSALP